MPNDADRSAERLDSWKDIAAYLRRDVSTVQRWEKREGMPVHRHLHEKLGSVYAFRSDLDAWSRGRGIDVARSEADASVPPELATPPPVAATVASRWRLAAVVGTLALLIAIAVVIKASRWRGGGTDKGASDTTGKVEAQDLVSRARYLSDRTTNADSKSAIALLEQAIALDPTLARAHAGLASAYVTRLAYVTPEETQELEQKSYAAAEKAFSLDPNLPDVYLARGDLLWTHSYRFAHERAIHEFRRALALNPESDQAHRRIARVLVHVGFFEEARHHADRALAANPSNSQALNTRAQSLLWGGQMEEALAILLSIPGPVLPELVPANTVFALHALGRREEASGYLQKAMEQDPADPAGTLRGMQALLLAESEPAKAQVLIDSVRQRKAANPSHHAAYFAASAAARLGHANDTVQWLKEAATTGFPCYALFARDPNLDPVRADPIFRAFMADMQKQSASLRKALFPDSK
jgi:tetratricopeptide (TPR) repeat protein